MARSTSRIVLVLVLSAFSGMLVAQTRYITDQLELPLRSGKSIQHKIVRMIPSGTKVEVLEEEDGYARIRTPSGAEGWVVSRYLTTTPSARDRLAAAQQRLGKLEIENGRLREKVKELSEQLDALKKERDELQKSSQSLSHEVARIKQAAASTLAIDNENKTLKARVLKLERELQTVQQENELLKQRTKRDWFLAGAGVLTLGVFLGWLLPRLRWRRRTSWDSL